MFKYVGKRNPEDSFDLTITVENDKGMVTPLKQIVRLIGITKNTLTYRMT